MTPIVVYFPEFELIGIISNDQVEIHTDDLAALNSLKLRAWDAGEPIAINTDILIIGAL